jgi:hypothetical protein
MTSLNKVAPAPAVGVLSLEAMDPDFNGDGVVEPMELSVYEAMKGADKDGDGFLTRTEVYTVIATSITAINEAAKGGIPINTLNPDSDGDGKVEKWEAEVFDRIKDADADKSGSISVKELFTVIKGAAESDRAKRMFRNLFFAALFVIIVLIGAMLAMSIVAGESIKENRNPKCDGGDCDPSALVSVGSVESFVGSIFDLPTVPTNQLAYLKSITMYVDMSATTNALLPAALVEFSFKIAGAFKASDSEAYLVTDNGYTIKLDATARTGSVTIGGEAFPVSDHPPEASRRSLKTSPDAEVVPTLSGRQLVEHHEAERRRLNMFAGALLTSGSFTMMASTGYRRQLAEHVNEAEVTEEGVEGRKLFAYGGALMTSGSFTMMASTGMF